MSPTPTHAAVFLAVLAIIFSSITQVESPPVPPLSEEKLNQRSLGCAPYTHWVPSVGRCVGCSPEDCLAGEELREDCGYNEEGHPVNSCRPCPNGTYSATGGQKQCQACKTCSSGYEQECNPKQPSVCLCADDEELAPDGTTCQKTCCLCLDSPNPSDIINECYQRYPGTDYHCKNSWSTGNTCTRPPEPTTTTVSPTTTSQQTTVRNVSIATPDTSKTPVPGPTFPVYSTKTYPPSEPTTENTGTSKPLPKHKGKQWLPWHVFVIAGTCIAGVLGIICCWKREKIRARLCKTSTGFDKLIEAESDGEGGGEEEEGEGKGGGGEEKGGEEGEEEEEGGGEEEEGEKLLEGQDEAVTGGADSGNVSKESSDAGSDKRDSRSSSKDSLLDSEGGQEEDSTLDQEGAHAVDEVNLDNEKEETVPKEVESEETMDFAGRLGGPPKDEKGLKAVPTAEGGIDLPGCRDNEDDQPTRERLQTAGPGTSDAQGLPTSSRQIQVPDFIQEKPLEAILNEEDLFSDLRVKLENTDRHYRNIGSYFGLTHEELDFIEFTELRGKDSPLRAILQKVTKTDESKTVGELLQYCDEKLKRRDVVKTVVEYFVEKEQNNQEVDMEVKESVVEDNLQQTEECCKKDNVDSEMKEVGSQSAAMNNVPEESLSESESSVAHKKLGTCDFNTEAIELVEIPS